MPKKIEKTSNNQGYFWGVNKLLAKKESPLFKGDDGLFKSVLENTKVYGEYGCGASTKWVLTNVSAQVLSVDTSKDWIEEVINTCDTNNLQRAQIHHVDLGELRDWGRPRSYIKRNQFIRYTDWIWEQSIKPDTILVDGRFRVCSFLTSLKFADQGAKILFDDYTNRPHYHIIEEYVEREEVCGRQCLFIVPNKNKIDLKALESDIINFRHVME